MEKSLWEIGYRILFSFNKEDDNWDYDSKKVVASSAEEAIEKAKKFALNQSDFIEGDNGPTKKKWKTLGFRLDSVSEVCSIDIF